jgi:hypothetical protein
MLLHVDPGVRDARYLSADRHLSVTAATINCPLHRLSSTWIDNSELSNLMLDLKNSSSGLKRKVLLIGGSHLEDQVTLCSLEALLHGFDVHLLCDIVLARDLKLKPVLLMRLFQAGAVPSSLRQFLYMWQTAENDQNAIQSLRKLLADYNATA